MRRTLHLPARFLTTGLLLLPCGSLPLRAAPPALPSPTFPAAKPADAAARDLLRRMLQAENALVLSGEQTTSLSRAGLDVSSEQRVLRNGASALRVDYERPPRLAGEQIVDNGHLYWHFVPSSSTLEVGPSRIGRLRAHIKQVLKQIDSGALRVQGEGQETVAGRLCGIVRVMPGTAQAPCRRFWIDLSTGAQLRIEQYDASGARLSASYYTSVTYNPALQRDDFRPPKPGKDVKVVALEIGPPLPTVAQAQAQAGFPLAQPAYLPPGFAFQSASLSNFRGHKMAALRYANGLNVLSLFETPVPPQTALPAMPPKPPHSPRPGVLMGDAAGLRLVVIGNMGQDELQKVLASVR